MPPENSVSTPAPSEASGARAWVSVSLFFGGLILGAIVMIPLMLAFLRSPQGSAVLRQFVSPQPQWQNIAIQPSATTTQLINDFVNGKTVVPIPKAYVSKEYAIAFNGVLREVAIIGTTTQALSTVLVEINTKSVSHDYNGIFDLVAQAKTLLANARTQVNTLGQDLQVLGTVNDTTPDAITRSGTIDMVSKGQDFQAGLVTLLEDIDSLLSGSIPTQQQITQVQTQSDTVGNLGLAFSQAVTTLETRFATTTPQ